MLSALHPRRGRIVRVLNRIYNKESYGSVSCCKPQRPIAVAMSGGIDSSVAAWLLKRQGYECIGVFMKNWDPSDEAGSEACTIDKDRTHMQQVCKRLQIPSFEV
jgi:tRNA(Ile)-lysidine synthase TilS/MesJ